MVDFGGSIRITGIVVSGMSISMVILLNSMYQVAYENDLYDNLTMTSPSSNLELMMHTTEATLPGGITKKECKKFLMYFAKKMLKKLNICSKQLKKEYPDRDEYSKRFDCSLRCVMKDVKLIDENFNMDNGTIHAFMEEWVPEKYRVVAWHFGMPCIDAHGYKLNDGDPYCKRYGEFVSCLQNAVADC